MGKVRLTVSGSLGAMDKLLSFCHKNHIDYEMLGAGDTNMTTRQGSRPFKVPRKDQGTFETEAKRLGLTIKRS